MSSLRALGPFLARYRQALLIGFVCALCGAVAAAFGPFLLGRAVDDLQREGVVLRQMLVYGALIVLAAVLDGLFKYGQRMLISGVSYRVERDMRTTLFNQFLAQDQEFFGHNHTGDLMARATNDLSAVRQLLGPGFSSLATALLTLIAAAVFMFATDWLLAVLVITLLPTISVVFFLVGQRMRRVFKSVQDQFGVLSTRAQENISGIRTIKAYAQEDDEITDFGTLNQQYRQLNLRYVLLSGLLWPSVALLLGIVAAVILLVGGRMVAAGSLQLGELVQFNAYLVLLAWPMIALGWTVNLYQQASASMVRLEEVLHRQPAIMSQPQALPLTIHGAIEFRHVSLRFDEVLAEKDPRHASLRALATATPDSPRWVLRDISFQIQPGQTLAIVGATGAGKSTLVNLLARVRDPDSGQILIDGHDLRSLPLETLRAAIGYVPQETFLFSVPLRENVTFGRPQASEQDIERAVRISRLSNDLSQFPNGLDTLVGERGVTLSGGQKQRTAIARAVLRDPTVLVLDDSLSSVDTHTAAEILSDLRDVLKDRTSILIAQRIASVKDADQIIVLHDGQIIERGNHRELLALGGRYAAMYRRELLQSELEEE